MYLHGIETIEIEQGSKPVNIVKSGVIGLIGIAPLSAKNQVIMVNSDRDDAQFGKQIPGFTIPQALNVIRAQGAGTVLVINVFDETRDTVAVTAEAQTIVNGKAKLAFAPIGTVTVLDSAGAPTTFVKDTDYSIDEFGNFKVLSNEIANATVLKFTYKKLDISTVTAAVINGEYNVTTNIRTGLKAFETAYNTFGINPKILIAPGFSTLTAVASGLTLTAEKFRAITYLDAPIGTTVNGAITGRGPAGTINFNTSNKRVELLYPHLKKYDPSTDAYVNFPFSAYLAGIRAVVDNTDGFWVSSSNREIKATIGAERALSSSTHDITSDTNILNEVGITTVFNTFGTGVRTWGNRNASFPSNTGADNFTNMVRIDDVVTDSLEQSSLQFIDRPINQGLIDSIRESGNAFMRVLIARGAVLPGSKIVYNKADNPVEELANGHITFERIYMGSTPAERITFKSILDINLLASIS